jgi:hypothetical protein
MKVLHAGVPYTVPAPTLELGKTYYATVEMRLYRIKYLGTDGRFDRHTIHKFEWLEGPKKGEVQRSYSQSFWVKPTRSERFMIWNDLTEYEKAKLLEGKYPGLKASDYINGGR